MSTHRSEKTLSGATDQELLDRTVRGEEDAFRELYQRHLDTIFRFAYRMLGNAEYAEDIAHDCFLSLIRNPRRFDSRKGSLRTYLYIAVRNLVSKRLRRFDGELPVDDETEKLPAESADQPLQSLLARELAHQVRKAIVRMPHLQREVILLFEYEGQSLADISAIVGTDVGAVKARLHRAREWLKREMAPYMNGRLQSHREHASNE